MTVSPTGGATPRRTVAETAALLLLLFTAAVAVFAPFLASETGPALFEIGPTTQDLSLRLSPPWTPGRPFGADGLGRDVLARVVYGLRASLLCGVGGALLALVFGVLWGVLAAGGRSRPARAAGGFLTFLADAASAAPPLLTAAAVQATFRPGPLGFVLLLGILRAPFLARLVRREAIRVADAPFVLAAYASGIPAWRVRLRSVLPHAVTPALVAAAFAVPGNIVAEAGLGFLGLGLPEPAPTIGGLLRDGRLHVPYATHLVFIPGVVVAALTLALQTAAEGLRRRNAGPVAEGAA